jgi:hypothetical protein
MSAPDASNANLPGWRVAAAFAVVLALAAALVLVARPRDEAPAQDPSAVGTPAGSAIRDAAAPAVSPASPPIEGEVVADLRAALAAWGEFAATGDLDIVDPHFWLTGPQREQLGREAPAILDDPPGPPPYEFVLSDPAVEAVSNDVVDVAGIVTVSRPGVDSTTYEWRLEMRRDPESGRWLLWTVTTSE